MDDEDFEGDLEGFYGDEEFVSIATGTKKAIHKAPSVATVITAAEIEAMGADTIYEVLETVTGIHIYPSNLDRMKPNFSIRGLHTAENPQTLVLVNGIRTTYEYTGSRWQQFNLGVNIIERIEVIRGPGSAVYGADAFSGVINIITKGESGKKSSDFGIKFGSFETKSGWFNYSESSEKLNYSFNVQWYETAGDDSRIVDTDAMHSLGLDFLSNAPGPLDTRYDSFDFHTQLSYENLYLHGWYLKSEGGAGAGAAQALSLYDIETVESLTLAVGYKLSNSEELKMDIKGYYQTHDDDTYFVIFPPGMALPRAFDAQGVPSAFTVFTDGVIGRPIAHETYLGVNWVSTYSGIQDHLFRTELGYRKSEAKPEELKNFGPGVLDGTEDFRDGSLVNVRGTPHIYMFDQERELYFLSFQDEWHLADDWELTTGIRYDDYSDFGSTVNPRVALVWQTKHNLTTKFLYGEAFRAPSFQELYAINNPVVIGNPNLEPEKIRTYEVVWDYRPGFDWQLIGNFYMYSSEDLITYVPQQDGTNVAQNTAKQDGTGAELEIRWKYSEKIDLKFGYAWQNAEDAENNQEIADAPGQMIDFSLNWKLTDDLNMYFDTRWIIDRNRLSTDSRLKIKDYNWTNVSLKYQVTPNFDTQLTIRNLADSDAFEPSDGQILGDYPLEERGVWFAMTYQY
ncbi:MAG: TonB-dependent receptor [Kangiellaceae bacterium]|nr:TonB-dependent receptor [Kangiellaceae bacterium]MCW9000561.1 TonB-dependent receptor [Kangiellaceae bacterium]